MKALSYATACSIAHLLSRASANLYIHAGADNGRKQRGVYQDCGIRDLRQAVDELGFDLVERMSPQEAHEAMLAKRRAEDGELVTDAAGNIVGPR